MKMFISTVAVMALAGIASAQALTLAGPGAQTFANGAGSGFGGPLGSGSITMNVSGGNLNVTFSNRTSLSNGDVVAVFLDTRSGGFTDAQMNDTADGGRNVLTNLTRELPDNFPIVPDFGIIFGNFGAVFFELNAGNTPGHLNFLQFDGGGTATLSLATLGASTNIDWFAALAGESGYLSNETLPAQPGINANGNIGFGDGQFGGLTPPPSQVDFTAFNRYVIPTPGAAALMGLGALAAGRRRR